MQAQDYFSLILSIGLFVFSIAAAVVVRGRSSDAFRITLVLFCFFTPVRAIILALGWDTMFPDKMQQDVSEILPFVLLLAHLWLIVFVATFATCRRLAPIGAAFLPPPAGADRIPRLNSVNLILLLLCGLTTAYIASRAGGVMAMPNFLKQERQGAGLYALRQFGSLGLFTSGACFLYSLKQKNLSGFNLALMIVFCGLTFLWGGREVIAAFMLFVISGLSLYAKVSRSTIISICGISLFVLVAMSYWRAEMISSGLVENQRKPIVRRVAVSMHMIRMDAMVLSYSHFQKTGTFRNGEDFKNGFIEAVPRVLWSGKPEVSKFGHALRLNFDRNAKNGWPVDTFAIWYINFGVIGVAIGAFLSGLLVSAVEYRFQDLDVNPLSLAVTVILSIEVFQGGFCAGWPSAYVLWVVPWAVIMFVIMYVKVPMFHFSLRSSE